VFSRRLKRRLLAHVSMRWDPIVGVDIAREAMTVAVVLPNQEIDLPRVRVHALSRRGEGRAGHVDVREMLRSVMPPNSRRCAIALDATEILFSPLDKPSRADIRRATEENSSEDSLLFDGYGYVTRVLDDKYRFILAMKNSLVRRYRSLASTVGLDLDVLTPRSFSIGIGLEALGVFHRGGRGTLIELTVNATRLSIYDDGYPFETTLLSDHSVDKVVEYLTSRFERTALVGGRCGIIGGSEEVRAMFHRSMEAALSMACVDVEELLRGRVVSESVVGGHSLGIGTLSSFGLCCIE
jgi:hypothetical protein